MTTASQSAKRYHCLRRISGIASARNRSGPRKSRPVKGGRHSDLRMRRVIGPPGHVHLRRSRSRHQVTIPCWIGDFGCFADHCGLLISPAGIVGDRLVRFVTDRCAARRCPRRSHGPSFHRARLRRSTPLEAFKLGYCWAQLFASGLGHPLDVGKPFWVKGTLGYPDNLSRRW